MADWNPIANEIFLEALELSPGISLEVYLRDACGDDANLSAHVRDLLRASDQAGSFLTEPAVIGPIDARDLRSFVAQLEIAEGEPANRGPLDRNGSLLTSLGDYRLMRLIGRGGMGSVYEAVQQSLGRRVALKVTTLHSALDPRIVERFRREARSAARLHHTNIVPVYEVGEHNDVHFYAMQFIDGESLAAVIDRLRKCSRDASCNGAATRADFDAVPTVLFCPTAVQGDEAPADQSHVSDPKVDALSHHEARRIPSLHSVESLGSGTNNDFWHQAAHIGWQVADALAYAHREHVLHRDVKPANLLVDKAGIIWITDFGVAKCDDADLTRTGDIVGTIRFMAPERFHGVSDERGDVYGLGMTLYELLTMQPAFDDSNRAGMLMRIECEDPLPPRRIMPRMPRDLETIVLKAIAKLPADRYQCAADLREDLGLFLENRPIRSRRVSLAESFVRWCRRNPLVAALEAAVVALCVAAIAILSASNASIRASDAAKSSALVSKQAAIEEASASEALAGRHLYASQMILAGVAFREGDWSRALDLLENQRPSSSKPDLRSFEWNYLWYQLHRGLYATLEQQTGGIWWLKFSHDGSLLAVCSGNFSEGQVKVWDVKSQRQIASFSNGDNLPNGIGFSPDGKRLMAGFSDGAVRVWEIDSGQDVKVLSGINLVRSADWSPDGKYIAAGCEDGSVHLWDTSNWAKWGKVSPHGGPVLNTVFSGDGRRLFTSARWGTDGPMCRVHDTSGASPQTIDSWPNRFVHDASHDGDEIAWFDGADVRFTGLSTGEETTIPQKSVGTISAVCLSQDGLRCATAGHDDRMAVLWDRKSQQRLVQGPHHSAVTAAAIDPRQRYWATGSSDGEVCIWHYDMPEEKIALTPDPPIKRVLVATDDGQIVLGGEFPARRWDLVREVNDRMGNIGAVKRLARDGRVLVGTTLRPDALSETIRVWDRASGRLRHEFNLPDKQPLGYESLALSSTGRLLATRTWDGPIRIWDLAVDAPKQIWELTPGDCIHLEFSPNEKLLAGACQFGRVRLWNVDTGVALPDIFDREGPWVWAQRLCFSPDGSRLAASNDVGVVRVWDVSSRKLINTLRGHRGESNDIQFFPDNRRLAVAGIGPVRIWDVEIGQECLELPVPDAKTISLAVTPDGRTLISASDHGVIRLWKTQGKMRARN